MESLSYKPVKIIQLLDGVYYAWSKSPISKESMIYRACESYDLLGLIAYVFYKGTWIKDVCFQGHTNSQTILKLLPIMLVVGHPLSVKVIISMLQLHIVQNSTIRNTEQIRAAANMTDVGC